MVNVKTSYAMYEYADLMEAAFFDVAQGYVSRFDATWPTDVKDLPDVPGWEVVLRHESVTDTHENIALYSTEEGFILIDLHGEKLKANYAANGYSALQAMHETVLAAFPKMHVSSDDIKVRFWALGNQGPTSYSRTISAPSLAEIIDNYGDDEQAVLADMAGPDFEPGVGGQLLLWHGEPGTGKTYALRALAQEWKSWCSIDYVTDPEQFLNERASYMMQVLMGRAAEEDDENSPEEPDKRGKWRLIVFEDTGELLVADAKQRVGQGLSRLLNVSEGFIGQGLKVLVLITTNEPLENLNPAVSRPGRCAINLKFEALDAAASVAWGERHGVQVERTAHMLSDLYAAKGDFKNSTRKRKKVGFATL